MRMGLGWTVELFFDRKLRNSASLTASLFCETIVLVFDKKIYKIGAQNEEFAQGASVAYSPFPYVGP